MSTRTWVLHHVVISLMLFPLLTLCGPSMARTEDCGKAKEYFTQAASQPLNPNDTKALLELVALYRKVLQLCPSHIEAHNNLADVYKNLGRYSEALSEYKAIISLDKDIPDPYLGIAEIHIMKGNYAEGNEWKQRGLKLKQTAAHKAPASPTSTPSKPQHDILSRNEIIELLSEPQIVTMGKSSRARMISFSTDKGASGNKGSIPFAYNDYSICEDARPQLDQLGEALITGLSGYQFEIRGHTDAHGSDSYNLQLSRKRAESVKGYLVKKFHVPPKNLAAKGYGKSFLIAKGTDELSNAMNRRVEILYIGKADDMVKANKADNSASGPQAQTNYNLKPDSSSAGSEQPAQADVQVVSIQSRPTDKRPMTSPISVKFWYGQFGSQERHAISPDGSTRLRVGENYCQVLFRTRLPCYAYVLQKYPEGRWSVLYPQANSQRGANPSKPHRDYWIPCRDLGFNITDSKGKVELYVLATPDPLPELAQAPVQTAEQAIPIVRKTTFMGLSHIGKPAQPKDNQTGIDGDEILRHVNALGGTVEQISFIHY